MGKKIRIGVLINVMYSDYASSFLNGIECFCKEHDCTHIVFPLLRGSTVSRYDFHYNSLISHINPNNIDVLIVASASMASFTHTEEVFAEIRSLPPMPIISVGVEMPGIPSIIIDSKKAIFELVEHLAKVHNRKKILLLRSDLESQESMERVSLYKQAFAANGIKFDEKKSLNGKFNFDHAHQVLSTYMQKVKKPDFDSIVCCNDNMALGCLNYLEENNLDSSKKISLTGFDNISFTEKNEFNITTIDQKMDEQGYLAAKYAFEKVKLNKSIPLKTVVDSELVLRNSCGCSDEQLSKIKKSKDKKSSVRNSFFRKSSVQLYMLHYFLLEAQEPVPLKKLYSRLLYCFTLFDIKASVLVLYDKPIYYKQESTFTYPEKATAAMVYTPKKGVVLPNKVFNPLDSVLPPVCDVGTSDMQVMFPLFVENYQYGYFLMTPGHYEKVFYQTMFELISKEIISSIKLSEAEDIRKQLESKNLSLEEYSEKLQQLSYTDEMTGLYNRRGFYQDAQKTISRYAELSKGGLVIYGDMDGLKSINDTFGHDAGDKAIKAEAEILKSLFRTTDIIGRLGGDEFVIVAPEMTIKDAPKIKRELKKKCDEYNRSEQEPFVLSISAGCVEFDNSNYCLENLLSSADKKLYEEKRAKKKKKSSLIQ